MALNKMKALTLALWVFCFAPAIWAQNVTVTSGTTYQTISGFGASSQWDNSFSSSLADTFWSDDSSQPPSSQVNGHAGLSILRLGIDDSGNGNWGSQCAFATQALGINKNVRVFGSPWSPPAKWKNNNSVDGNNTGSDNFNPGSNSNQLNSGNYGNYASYLTSFATACKNTYGFTPYAISVQNEPDYDPSYDACLWSPSAIDTFVGSYLGPDLNAAGFNNIVMIPESFADNLTGANTAMGDSNAAKYVKVIGMHLYGGGPNTIPSSYSTTAGHAVESWCTEVSEKTSDNNIDSGVFYAGELHSCIVDHNYNAYCYWWLVPTGTDDEGLCDNSGNPTKRLYTIGNYSKFIRPGYVRIGATEVPSSGVSVSAYYSATDGKVVIVAINGNTGSSANVNFNYSDLNVSTVYPWVTSSSLNLVQQTAVAVSGGKFSYTLPAQSVVSFVASAGGGTPVPTFTPTPAPPTPTPIVASTWRVNAGGPAYTDTLGNVWAADENFNGGTTVASGGTITGTSDSTLYDTQRYGTFSYSFNVPAGSYQVTLKLAETYSGDFSSGTRVFNIAINGTTVASNLDIFAQVGSNTADDKVFNNISPSGGVITITFTGGTSTDVNAVVEALQVIPQPATPTATRTATSTATSTSTSTATSTPTRTNTPVPPTATFTVTSTTTATPSSSPTSTWTSTDTPVPPTATKTNTPVPPTPTNTSVPPTFTDTPAPPTATGTNSPVPPTFTNTPLPPTATITNSPVPPTTTFTQTPLPPTATWTNSPVPPTATNTAVPPTATNSPVPPTATLTHTPVPPTSTFTAVPPTATFTLTPVPPTATFTHTPVPPTATFTLTPLPPTDTPTAVIASSSFTVKLLSGVTNGTTNSPHPFIQVVNTGTGPLSLNNVEVRYWFNCDCTTQSLQVWVDWAGLLPAGTSVTGDVVTSVVPTSLGGQTDYISYKFTGNLVLQPGQMIEIQSRFNKSDWSNMTQSNDWSFAPNTSYTNAPQVTGYLGGALVWGEQPVGAPAALSVSSVLVFPNPSTGNGTTLSFNFSGRRGGPNGSLLSDASPLLLDPNAKITLGIYSLAWRLIWTQTLTGGAYGTTGNHDLYWNERDFNGAGLANGVYILKVTVESKGQTSSALSRILILK